MKANFFFDLAHADAYLRGSIIRIKKEPIYVVQASIHQQIGIYYTSLTDMAGSPKFINLKDNDINLYPPELGFINTARFNIPKICKAFRTPARLWKIGLTIENVKFFPMENKLLFSKPMYNCIVGNYPKYEEALSIIKKNKNSSCAFSRKFAISSKNEVLFIQL